ncbi:NmrA-like family protein [Paecilomyces variotii No. 5]|uniref:NmrA-like family protein n=1 Tax=Byssochlamys spectabilis (strain No. 5 / NBRC 109023) TaxID=1356009 RepID=V5G129_BYSSN|nr:NmrA-like family protein [Paecilomyces variotii No. 5]
MAPTILIAGATGNTGRSVVETLPKLLDSAGLSSKYRIIALTRSSKSPAAQQLVKFPGVEVVEKNWVDITSDWLREHQVIKAFIASHNAPNQFAEESTFHTAALNAGVKYVVRISTTAPNVRPDCKAYYARAHWAIETLLGTPEFAGLQWTSLQANSFSQFYLASAAQFILQYRQTKKQDTLRLMGSEDAPVGIIDAYDVGIFAAHLLAQEDPSAHNKARYVLNGPEDITGKRVVEMVEQYIGTRVENVAYKDMLSVVNMLYESSYAATSESKNVIMSIRYAAEPTWEGKCSASTTSKEVLDIAAPKRTPAEALESLLRGAEDNFLMK